MNSRSVVAVLMSLGGTVFLFVGIQVVNLLYVIIEPVGTILCLGGLNVTSLLLVKFMISTSSTKEAERSTRLSNFVRSMALGVPLVVSLWGCMLISTPLRET